MPKPSIKGEVMLAERCPDPATSKSNRMRASFHTPLHDCQALFPQIANYLGEAEAHAPGVGEGGFGVRAGVGVLPVQLPVVIH